MDFRAFHYQTWGIRSAGGFFFLKFSCIKCINIRYWRIGLMECVEWSSAAEEFDQKGFFFRLDIV